MKYAPIYMRSYVKRSNNIGRTGSGRAAIRLSIICGCSDIGYQPIHRIDMDEECAVNKNNGASRLTGSPICMSGIYIKVYYHFSPSIFFPLPRSLLILSTGSSRLLIDLS